jgi:CheY-like chemotaxis protein
MALSALPVSPVQALFLIFTCPKTENEMNSILLIDDDADDQLIFKEAMSEITDKLGCIFANNGFEALSCLIRLDPAPSIAFLDLNMPIMNGFECLEQIRKNDQWRKIPVVIFSTSNNPEDKRKSEKLGATAFLTKTADFQLLKIKLSEILQSHFSAIELFSHVTQSK